MFAIAFDLVVAQVRTRYNGSIAAAYGEIRGILEGHGFEWTQGSLYVLQQEDMSILFQAIQDLSHLSWFPHCVRDIRAFRVEQWSNFTSMVHRAAGPTPPVSQGGSGSGPAGSGPSSGSSTPGP